VHLREFLYADIDRVRSLMGQLSDGVPEESKEIESKGRQNKAEIKAIASTVGDTKTETQISKSLADSVFSELEDILEAGGWLVDVSEELAGYADLSELPKKYPPGTLVRITSLGQLFDARYIARVFSGISATVEGLHLLPGHQASPVVPPAVKKAAARAGKPRNDEGTLEAEIRDFDPTVIEGITPDLLRAIVKISRGVLSTGVHLMLTPRRDEITVSARLQEGRQYLETDAEILFSRYGTSRQEWTVVGSVGAYSTVVDPQEALSAGFVNDDRVSRSMLAEYVNNFMQIMGNLGFADLPQHPGFSIVPLAVYRLVPKVGSKEINVAGAVV
jgi:hypothetical protein